MKARLFLTALLVSIFTNAPVPIRAQAKPKAAPYLSQSPTVERVKAQIKGTDLIDTQARLTQAFSLLNHMIQDLAGRRYDDDEMSKAEEDLMWEYVKAYNSYAIDAPAPSAQDAPRLHQLNELYEKDPGFLDDLLQRFFSREFRAVYYRATKKQPPGSSQNPANPPSDGAAAADAELGFPT